MDEVVAVIMRICRKKRVADDMFVLSKVVDKLISATRRAGRAAEAVAAGAVLPLRFWELAGLRTVWSQLRAPPRIIPGSRDALREKLHRLWRDMIGGGPVSHIDVINAFVAAEALPARWLAAMQQSQVVGALAQCPCTIVIAAAYELAEKNTGPKGANPNLAFATKADFLGYVAKATGTGIDDMF